MRILRAADQRTTPWKNGGGVTTEICVSPAGAGLDDFDWRVSMAKVASDGLFSCFSNVDRSLAVLSGEGIELTVADAPPVKLTPSTPPFSFPGDAATLGRLLDGPILDLNIMVRRDKYRHNVRRISLDAPRTVVVGAHPYVLLCAEGGLRIETPENEILLSPLDAAFVEEAGTKMRLYPTPIAVAYLVEIADIGCFRSASIEQD